LKFDQHLARQFWLPNDRHANCCFAGHPWRKMSASAIGLHDDQVRLASIAIHSNDINPLAEARVKRIADNDIVAIMMGSVLWVRPVAAKVI
jgi:hypothetical protein